MFKLYNDGKFTAPKFLRKKKSMTSVRASVRGRSSSTVASPLPSATGSSSIGKSRGVSPNHGVGNNTTLGSVVRESKLRRPSLPNISQTQNQRSLINQNNKDISRPPSSTSRLHPDNKNDHSLSTSHIARPSSSLSNRSHSSSTSPRLPSSNRFAEKPSSSNPSSQSHIAKPNSRTQKSSAVKPPSIVTLPNSNNGSTSTSKKGSSLPIAPNSNSHNVQNNQSQSPSAQSVSPSLSSTSLSIPTRVSPRSTSPSSLPRSKNRLHAGVDSACFMARSSSDDSLVPSSPCSSTSSTPTISSIPTMSPLPSASTATGSETLIISNQRKPISRQPSTSDFCTTTTISKTDPSKISLQASPFTASDESHNISTNLAHEDRRESISNSATTTLCMTSPEAEGKPSYNEASVAQCQCPPLEFPENIRRELKRVELEHQHQESELYSKIIDLQIENANLKGDKETLHRVISHRDKMLMELRVQLQAMEFFCRENDISVDIEMCSDEVIENWSFKESDEVYQRILLTTQDLVRTGSKCLEENRPLQQRTTRSSSVASKTGTLDKHRYRRRDTLVSGFSEGIPSSSASTSIGDGLYKETSRPGTVSIDLRSLLKSEEELCYSKDNKSTVTHSNLATIDAGIVERDGRRALDGGEDRSAIFRADSNSNNNEYDSLDEDDDGDESQDSEFEELGEDMIKYVELQPSVGPRRESRASSFSRMMSMTPYGGSVVGTPDLSTSVLMRNYWGGNASRRSSSATTPMNHPFHQYQYQSFQQRGMPICRSSAGSDLSNSSLIEDYFSRGLHPMDQVFPPSVSVQSSSQFGHGVGLGLTGTGRSPEQLPMERFLSAPSPCQITPNIAPLYSPRLSGSPPIPQHPYSCVTRSPLANSSAVFYPHGITMNLDSSKLNSKRNSASSTTSSVNANRNPPPPPMMPLPPLPKSRLPSQREQFMRDLLDPTKKANRRTRTISHGFAIENVEKYLERKQYGKILARDLMLRGHQRRLSV